MESFSELPRASLANLNLLPEDRSYLAQLMRDGEPEIILALLVRYRAIWADSAKDEPLVHRQDNQGRRAANIWIRQEVEALRHQTSKIVEEYQRIIEQGPPKCCHTCESYGQHGRCATYEMEPPEDFAATPDKCPDWAMEIPF